MVKIDFMKKTIQLWPEEYQGEVKISSMSLSYTNFKGGANIITFPKEWISDPNITSQEISLSSSTTAPPEPLHDDLGTDTRLKQTEKTQNLHDPSAKQEFPTLKPIWNSIEELQKRIYELKTFQVENNTLSESLTNHKEDFQKKMGFIKGFVEQFQDFVNKLERRILRVEHCLMNPFGEALTEECFDKDPVKKNKSKPKR